jgi:uncharacterized protein (TIGR03437 family)
VPVGYPQTVIVQVVDNCYANVDGATVLVSFSSADSPLVLADLRNGFYSGTWTPKNGSGAVRLNIQASQPRFTSVSAQLNGQLGSSLAPFISTHGVVSAASYRPLSALAPGGIFAVFGSNLAQGVNVSPGVPLPKSLGNLSLRLGSLEVPLFYVGASQVNAQLPFEAQANASLPLLASISGSLTSPESVAIAATQPGIFTTDQSGSGQGAILSAGGVLVDTRAPVAVGEVIQIYCTGLGLTQPPAVSGSATPTGTLYLAASPVTAKVGGVNATVQFAGLAPGFVGLYQVNVAIPSGVAPGSAVSLVLTQDGRDSNTVTLAVK